MPHLARVGAALVTAFALATLGGMTAHAAVPDTTPPVLTLPPDVTAEARSASGATVAYAVSATDETDPASPPVWCTRPSGSEFALGMTTVSCGGSDSAGNLARGSFTVTVQDTTGPAVHVPGGISFEATGPSGAAATFHAVASDLVDGQVPVDCQSPSGTVFPLGPTTVTCTARDAAGNTGSDSFTVRVVDGTPPRLSLPVSITAEATSAAGAAVNYVASATDLVDRDVPVTCSEASGSTFSLGSHQINCLSTDAAGNSAFGAFLVRVQDTTGPTISWVDGPGDGVSYGFGEVPAAGSCTAYDLVSGPVSCTVVGYGTTAGLHDLAAYSLDGKGNLATATRTYSVTEWRLSGFFRPFDVTGAWNVVKGGSTLPLKFEVFAGATELTSTTAVASVGVTTVSCPGAAALRDAGGLSPSGGTSLRYDNTGGQFILTWRTPKKAGACYAVTVRTQDGSTLTANFRLR